MTSKSPTNPIDHGGNSRWPWQRSLQYRIAATYGLLFFVVLLLLIIWIGRLIYDSYLEAQEHDLIMTAFLATNALENPLSGFGDEFEAHEHWEAERYESGSEEDDESDEDEGDDIRDDRETPRTKILPPNANTSDLSALILPRLNQAASTYASDTNARVTILDSRGAPLADSRYTIDQIGNQQQSTEFRAALRGMKKPTIYAWIHSGVI